MIKSSNILSIEPNNKRKPRDKKGGLQPYKKLLSMGKISIGLINELDSPIDSINRFINLALQTIEEDSHSRQFLLESKQGIKKTAQLLKRLNNYARKIEKEINGIQEIPIRNNGQKTYTISK
jgi:hypothetical protein